MRAYFFGLALAATLACSNNEAQDDDSSSTTSSSTTTSTGGNGTGGNGVGGGAGGGANACTEGSAEAQAFCTLYASSCGMGMADRYEDCATCAAAFDAADMPCKTCWDQHLGFVSSMGVSHCPHACDSSQCGSCEDSCQ